MMYGHGNPYGYGGPMMVPSYGYQGKPGVGLIKKGDEQWLDHLDNCRIVGGGCCTDVKVESDMVKLRLKKQGSGCTNSYHAYINGEKVAVFGNMPGSCGNGSRYTQCPPGREVMTAVVRREGYGKHAPTYYMSHFRAGEGVGGAAHIRYRIIATSCGNNMPICDVMGRIIAHYDPPSCTCGCGEIGNLKFAQDATPVDKLAAIDLLLVSVDRSCANPCRHLICLIFLIPLLVFILLYSLSGILAATAGDDSTKTTRAPNP